MKKLQYLWQYYKWAILALCVVLAVGISFLCVAVTKKECALYVMLIDCHAQAGSQQMEQEACEALQLDTDQYSVEVLSSLMFTDSDNGSYTMTSLSRFLADVGSERLDVCAMYESDFLKYDEAGAFLDLRKCLSEEQIDRLDGMLMVQKNGRIIGVYADKLWGMQKNGCYTAGEERGVIGILYNTWHQENAVRYMMYLAGEGA